MPPTPAAPTAPSPTPAAATAKKERKPVEPSSFTVPNLSRMTPLQAPLLSFPEGRYTPVRPIGDSSLISAAQALDKNTATSAISAQARRGQQVQRFVGGSIVLLRDSKKGETGEYVELDKSLWPEDNVVAQPEVAAEGGAAAVGGDIQMDDASEEIAAMPEPFEYPFEE